MGINLRIFAGSTYAETENVHVRKQLFSKVTKSRSEREITTKHHGPYIVFSWKGSTDLLPVVPYSVALVVDVPPFSVSFSRLMI
jgi:hypothetical protein